MDTRLEEGLRRKKDAVAGKCSHVCKAIKMGRILEGTLRNEF